MGYGLCNLSVVPLRIEPSDKSEMVSQVLFGDHFKILEKSKQWRKIRLAYDHYEGWIDEKQFQTISKDFYKQLEKADQHVSTELVEAVVNSSNELLPIPIGTSLPLLKNKKIDFESTSFIYEGKSTSGKNEKENLVKTAFMYLNAPYLWGGKTPYGIDCSGLTQMVYKLNGYKLLRDASQQATQGDVLSFIEESEPGDLAFFDNKDGEIIHVGIIMANNYIIHASGKVRVDRLDQSGIFNEELKKHTHKLRVIKKIF
ncbi:MAG: C40 family peptidase [Flavobacteriaceae bacterium]|nr:C40 family peptidase [Flavobacteriaceae bacterium]